MSDFDPRYYRSPKNPPRAEVTDFQPEDFAPEEPGAPSPGARPDAGRQAPARPGAPDPFEEFQVDRQPLSGLMSDLPSLDGLFKPFDLTVETPDQNDHFAEIFQTGPPAAYLYEDLDTRDPEVIRTLAQAEEQRAAIIRAAEEQASRLVETAVTEARGLVAEARTRQDVMLNEARQGAEEIDRAAQIRLERAEEQRAAAEQDRQAAGEQRAEAEAQLAAAAERIAGLDQERQTLAAEHEARQNELAAEHAARLAELEASRDGVLAEAQAAGRREGFDRGLEEGRAAGRDEALKDFQNRVENLLTIMGKMENIYQELWAANGPMMIKLAIEAAEAILNKELKEAPDLAARAFEACIDFLSQAHRVTFLARPQDIAQLEAAKAEQRARLGALVKVTFQPDETLGPGDLIVESDIGRLDATVKHRTEQVLRVLREAFDEAHGGLAAAPPPEAAGGDPSPAEPARESSPAAAPEEPSPAEASVPEPEAEPPAASEPPKPPEAL